MLVIKSVLQNMQACCDNIERIQIVKSLFYFRKGSSNIRMKEKIRYKTIITSDDNQIKM